MRSNSMPDKFTRLLMDSAVSLQWKCLITLRRICGWSSCSSCTLCCCCSCCSDIKLQQRTPLNDYTTETTPCMYWCVCACVCVLRMCVFGLLLTLHCYDSVTIVIVLTLCYSLFLFTVFFFVLLLFALFSVFSLFSTPVCWYPLFLFSLHLPRSVAN